MRLTGILRLVAMRFTLVESVRIVGFGVFGIALIACFVDGALTDVGCSAHFGFGFGGYGIEVLGDWRWLMFGKEFVVL